MKCSTCGKAITSGRGYPGVGIACSAKCFKALKAEIKKRDDELLAEDLTVPEELDGPGFERFVLKFTLHLLRDLPPKSRANLKRVCPLLLIPEQMALEIKEKVLRHLPLYYVSSIEAEGFESWECKGRYQFKCKVPAKVMVNAFEKADLIVKD